ncbi:MAG: phosphatase PAP2 family protein, partial [Microbacterium sp.]
MRHTPRHPAMPPRRSRTMPRWVRRLDRAAGRRINASRSWHVHDRAYSGLSHAADHGVLWYSIAATLLMLGHPRAALRGVGSMLIASVVSDVIVKSFFDGRRPVFDEVPSVRRLRAYPTTPSFPSGHSASAAGFATGVALESAQAGIVVAPLAAAVAYSRMHVGAHWLSDVVGGVAIGAGVAVLGRLIVPARGQRQPDEPEVAQVVEPIVLPASADGAGVLIVMNKDAGTAVIRLDPRPTIAERLPRAVVRELEREEGMDDAVRAAMAGEDPPRILGVYGGDGSVSRMAHLALEFDLPLLALPGGTFNHFARTAGI